MPTSRDGEGHVDSHNGLCGELCVATNLDIEPSLLEEAVSLGRHRSKRAAVINHRQSHTPLPGLIGRLKRHLRGWANYFGQGYPRGSFRQLNRFARYRLGKHLQRRSQRGWRARQGVRNS